MKHEGSNDTTIAILENSSAHVIDSLHRIERHIEKLEKKLNQLENKFEDKIEQLSARVWIHVYWLLSILVVLGLLIAYGFKWF